MKKKINIIVIIHLVLTLIFAIILVYSIFNIGQWVINNKENKDIKNDMSKYIFIENNDSEDNKYVIDFKKIKEKNPDTVGYIKVNNTSINYIVVKGSDNSYYLNHNFNKEYNKSGWIFSDYKNKYDGTDKNIILYGHNIKDGSMFGTLYKVLNKNWYDNPDNYIIDFVTENNSYKYQVFSVYEIDEEDYYIQTEFNNDNNINDFINTLKNRSYKDFGIEVNNNDQILTLSTCNKGSSKRIVLHSKLIK